MHSSQPLWSLCQFGSYKLLIYRKLIQKFKTQIVNKPPRDPLRPNILKEYNEKKSLVRANVPGVIEVKLPLQIAIWFPNKYDGRLTAITVGYLTILNNCLALARDSRDVTTKDDNY